jgi:YfiR/HmsC-like
MPGRSRSLWFVALIASALVVPRLISGEVQAMEEDTIKAVYTYQFGKFTEWPAMKFTNSQATLNFCILGKNPFRRSALDAIENKQVRGRHLKIEFYQSGLLSSEAIAGCHILFISESEKNRLRSILAELKQSPVLTVSDIENFAQHGGMIALVKAQQQVRFEINSIALRHAGLVISSKLLELSKIIYREKAGDTH